MAEEWARKATERQMSARGGRELLLGILAHEAVIQALGRGRLLTTVEDHQQQAGRMRWHGRWA